MPQHQGDGGPVLHSAPAKEDAESRRDFPFSTCAPNGEREYGRESSLSRTDPLTASGWLKLLFVLNDDGGIWLRWGHRQAKLTERLDVILETRSGLVETVLNRMSHSAEAFKFE